jgi:hypothetical protein
MKAHVIENGVVINTIEVDSLDVIPNLIEATEGGIGWAYSDGVFTAPIIEISDEEKSRQGRKRRNSLLSETDWTASTDVTMSADMTIYREALRDVPAQSGFPNTITWPEAP